jgi:hypothetical protein
MRQQEIWRQPVLQQYVPKPFGLCVVSSFLLSKRNPHSALFRPA